jgi:hypothetical protein
MEGLLMPSRIIFAFEFIAAERAAKTRTLDHWLGQPGRYLLALPLITRLTNPLKVWGTERRPLKHLMINWIRRLLQTGPADNGEMQLILHCAYSERMFLDWVGS